MQLEKRQVLLKRFTLEDIVREVLKTEYKKSPIFIYDSVDSTNNIAKTMARADADHGTIIMAKGQTAARGRKGRFFYSPPEIGMYLSVILKRHTKPDDALFITVAAAVATSVAIENLTGKQPLIKWVNDLFLNGKKVCGILAEGVSGDGGKAMESIVVGIGVNIKMDRASLPKELDTIVGALDADVEPARLAGEIVNHLLDMEKDLRNPQILRKYKERSLILGRNITYLDHGEKRQGMAIDINDQGNLVIRKDDGELELLQSGEVSVIIG